MNPNSTVDPLPPLVVSIFQQLGMTRLREPFTLPPLNQTVTSALVLTAMHDVYVTPGHPKTLDTRLDFYLMLAKDTRSGASKLRANAGVDAITKHWRKHPSLPDDAAWRAMFLDPIKVWHWSEYDEAIADGLAYHRSPRPTPFVGPSEAELTHLEEPEEASEVMPDADHTAHTEASQPINQRALAALLFDDPPVPTNKE